jgi:pimeloyl-ACP methyl ester carboxylesterase
MLTIEDYGRVVAEVIDALGIGPVHLVGNSFGSVVAAEVAAAHARRVAGLVLVGCPAWKTRTDREAWLHARSQVLLTDTGDAVAVDRDLVATMFPEVEDAFVECVAEGFQKAGTWIRNVMWALYAYDSTSAFRQVVQPTLVVYGEHDWLQATADHLQGQLRNCSRVTIPGGAHMTPVNRPGQLAAAVVDHIRRVSLETTKA